MFYNKLRNYVTVYIIIRKNVLVKNKLRNYVKGELAMIFIYDLIEELCQSRGITVTTLCKECKIPRSTMTDYKKGRIKSLSAGILCKIADYFDVTVDYLCGVSTETPNEEVIKKVLFGEDFVVTNEIWEDLKKYIDYLKSRNK